MADKSTQAAGHDWRDRVLTDPNMILEDRDLMRALILADGSNAGQNIVDLRGIAMDRLETRLDRLEDTHRSVIAAAYENLAGTNQIHRCVLRMLDCATLGDLLDLLTGEMTDIMRVDRIRLVLESAAPTAVPHLVVVPVAAGFADDYLSAGRETPERVVTLRECPPASTGVFGEEETRMRSEALLRLDLGAGRLPGLLALGSEDAHQFRASQGIELLTFFTAAFERVLRRHLG